MRGYFPYVTEYEYESARKECRHAQKNADSYRAKYLELRKQLREYEKATGVNFPAEIRKAIGVK